MEQRVGRRHFIILLLFLDDHRETVSFDREIREESDQLRFLYAVSLTNIKGSVLILGQGKSYVRDLP